MPTQRENASPKPNIGKVTLSDVELLEQIAKGDAQAYAVIYDRYVDAIYRFIAIKVRSRADAEDLTSDVFLKSWQYLLRQATKITQLRAFLYTVARRSVIDHYRKAGREREQVIPLDDDALGMLPDNAVHLDVAFDERLLPKVIARFMDELEESARDVLVLRYLDELSVAETAEVLEKSPGAVRVLTFRALRELRKVAQQRNFNW